MAFRRPGDDPSVFAIELETLARRAFADVNTSIQLQLVRDRFITGQAECTLRRHRDSMGPPIPSDRDLLMQRLLGVVRPVQPVVQERSRLTDIEILLQSMLQVGSVKEVDVPPPAPRPESPAGCFSCGDLTHETEQCPVLDESFPFLPVGWRADRIDDEFIL